MIYCFICAHNYVFGHQDNDSVVLPVLLVLRIKHGQKLLILPIRIPTKTKLFIDRTDITN